MSTLQHKSLLGSLCLALALVGAMPSTVGAATVKPTCSVKIITKNGEIKTKSESSVAVSKGEVVTLGWESKNAKTAVDASGNKVALSGTLSETVTGSKEYEYTFINGTKKATCTIDANVVEASIDVSALSSKNSKPTLKGSAVGIKNVEVEINDRATKKTLWSKEIKVKSNKWKVESTKKLNDGSYDVVVLDSASDAVIANGTLMVNTGKGVTVSNKVNTTLSVSAVPLLVGGTAKTSGSVPVTYLKVVNVGKEVAVLTGITLKQNGTSAGNAVIGFTVVDDKNESRVTVGGEGSTPFKNGVANIGTNITFAPNQMRVITVKANLSNNVTANIGKTLMLEVSGIEANATLKGTFPIRGTTWTVAR